MRKTLTFSLSLAAAFSVCSLSLAGHHNRAVPSAQCEAPSAQCAAPSAQSEGCGDVCGPVKKKCHLFDMFKHKPKCYTYEWVLKKKKVKHHKGGCGGEGCGAPACDSCGVSYPSAQGMPSGQYLAPTAQYVPAGQAAGVEPPPAPEAAPAPAPAPAPAAPPAPATPPAPSANAGGLLYLSPAGN